MDKHIFIFDLDSTITKEEILPKISISVNKLEEMRHLTEATMLGELPFEESFTNRVKLLSDLPVDYVQDVVANVLLNENLANFIRKHKDICYIVTGNLDAWICKLVEKLGMQEHCFCSHAKVVDNKLLGIETIINKKQIVSDMGNGLVVIGDGSNDADMISVAEVGIGFGGVRDVAPAVLKVCTHAIYDENKLVEFLNKLI